MPKVKFLTKAQLQQLYNNCAKKLADRNHDPKPVVRFFNIMGRDTFVFTYLADVQGELCFFGLHNLTSDGRPKLGYVTCSAIRMSCERDKFFRPKMTLGEYIRQAEADPDFQL